MDYTTNQENTMVSISNKLNNLMFHYILKYKPCSNSNFKHILQ